MEKYNIGEQKKKVCTKCKNELPATTYYFRRHRRCKDGLYTQCKVCCGQKYGIYRTRNYVDRSNEKQGYKICTRCEKQLKLSEYGNEPRNNDGKKSQCVNCFKKTRKEWEERVNHKGNYDPAYQREWHQKNPNYRREVYAKNREAELKRSRRWYEKNKDTKEYRERARRESHIWRQRINNSSYNYSETDWQETLNYFKNQCCYCGTKSDLERDHFVPLSEGGPFIKSNIVPACRSCNASKQNKSFEVWYPKQLFYTKNRENRIKKFIGIKDNIHQLNIL